VLLKSNTLIIIGMRHSIEKNKDLSIGILYIATGEKYIKAAIASAKTVKKYSPDIPIHFCGDWQNYSFNFEFSTFPFSSVQKIENPHKRSKVDYMPQTPFERTLYLDTDIVLNADVTKMFDVLDRFDIALAHAFRRNDPSRLKNWKIVLPQVFPQFNSGVFLYRKTPEVICFLEKWRDNFKTAGFEQDQVTLRELIWLSDLRIATLPPEYNVRYLKYHYLWSKSEASTKIFHLQRLHTGWFLWIAGPSFRRFLRYIKRLGIRLPDEIV